jgi:hypothetical protein
MAEDVATDVNTVRWRTAGSRKYVLAVASLEPMAPVYRLLTAQWSGSGGVAQNA